MTDKRRRGNIPVLLNLPSLFLILPVPPPFLLLTADAVDISMTIPRHFRCLETTLFPLQSLFECLRVTQYTCLVQQHLHPRLDRNESFLAQDLVCRATTPSLMRMAQEFCSAWVSDLLQGGLVPKL